jgi:ppGpp synthetase/RelA/SpoT-type nucleotidyltranferase
LRAEGVAICIAFTLWYITGKSSVGNGFMSLTRSRLKKIGKDLKKGQLHEDFEEAYQGLNEYRQLFFPLMTQVNNRCRSVIKKYLSHLESENYIIAQRSKRLESIVMKLERPTNTMQLDTMQDVGGVRVILPTLDDVTTFVKHYPSSRSSISVDKTYDYIANPKEDGYRSIHLVNRLQNKDELSSEKLPMLPIELQVRTEYQHAWATAVEVAGTMEKSSFKTGQWSKEWLNFFVSSSATLSDAENTGTLFSNEALNQVLYVDKKEVSLKLEQLSAYSKSMKIVREQSKLKKYKATTSSEWVVDVNFKDNSYGLYPPQYNQTELLQAHFQLKELHYQRTQTGQIIRLKVATVDELFKAYPNLFLDTSLFVHLMKTILDL